MKKLANSPRYSHPVLMAEKFPEINDKTPFKRSGEKLLGTYVPTMNSPRVQAKITPRTITMTSEILNSLTPKSSNTTARSTIKPLTYLQKNRSHPTLASQPRPSLHKDFTFPSLPKKPRAVIRVSKLSQSTSDINSSNKLLKFNTKKEESKATLSKTYDMASVVASSPSPSASTSAYQNHLKSTFQCMEFIQKLPNLDSVHLNPYLVNLPKRPGYENKKTLIFDLDETLVHCITFGEKGQHDVMVDVRFPNGMAASARLKLRPFLKECLEEANKLFEVMVFTASHQCYADAVLNYLDPDRRLIHHRLYRNNCISINGANIKDLRIFTNRNLKDVVLVDNNAFSFAYQLDNGVPIISWYDDPADMELKHLIAYMKILALAEDVREVNRRTFSLHTFHKDYIRDFGVPHEE